jgi:hypothetical protein
MTLSFVGTIVFALIQCIRPSIPSSAATAEVKAPADAVAVLHTSCYSCHSNERRLSWFDQIEPAYFLVRHDILKARSHLNFSTIGARPAPAQRSALFEAVNMVQLGAMPLPSFLALHPDARVDPAQLEKLKDYLAPWGDTPGIEPQPADATYPSQVAPEYGGLAFDPTYTGWHLLSVTDRGDNNTFRFILGNDIAVNAASTGHTNPWPDGTRFAKIAWKQRSTPEGLVEPGQFIQIEQMLKDSEHHRQTEGWAWGRWRGPGFTPYGTDASVVTECTGCHAPLRKNDFVYTMPISAAHAQSTNALNNAAAPTGPLPFDLSTASPLTMFVDRKAGTMSVLYGKKLANSPGTAPGSNYTPGTELLLITWQQVEDPHWFGARIPGSPLSYELVTVGATPGDTQYERIDAHLGHQVPFEADVKAQRTRLIEQMTSPPCLF